MDQDAGGDTNRQAGQPAEQPGQRSTTLSLRSMGGEWKITTGDLDMVPQP